MHFKHGPPPPHHGHHHPPHHHGPHERHPFDSLIQALRLLVQRHGNRRAGVPSGLQTVADLIAIAESALEPGIAELLRGFNPELDPTLAIDKLDVILAEEAGVLRRQIHALAAEHQVALIGPLPPFIHEAFADYDGATILFPEGDQRPPHLRAFDADRILRSVPACRRRVSTADLIIFDVFRNGRYFAAPEIVDLIDDRIIQTHARLLVHLRPHQNPDDTTFDGSIAARLELY